MTESLQYHKKLLAQVADRLTGVDLSDLSEAERQIADMLKLAGYLLYIQGDGAHKCVELTPFARGLLY